MCLACFLRDREYSYDVFQDPRPPREPRKASLRNFTNTLGCRNAKLFWRFVIGH